ncbi:MAG: hypothetical protein MJ247_02955 [Alphaproteobacteria bacterium]|nr:hypothetical protein [Alphaproteobacteria bacterium]
MFFWYVLGMLFSCLAFGIWSRNSRDLQDVYEPTYEAVAMNFYTFHNANVSMFQELSKWDSEHPNQEKIGKGELAPYGGTNGFIQLAYTKKTGNAIVSPIKNSENIQIITKYLPYTYKPTPGMYSYVYCTNAEQGQSGDADCSALDSVKYVVTLKQLAQNFTGSNKMAALNAIANATSGSKSVGYIEKAKEKLVESDSVFYQPIGSHYKILSGGYSQMGDIYIPDSILCDAKIGSKPVINLIKTEKSNIMIALTLMSGLTKTSNKSSEDLMETYDCDSKPSDEEREACIEKVNNELAASSHANLPDGSTAACSDIGA